MSAQKLRGYCCKNSASAERLRGNYFILSAHRSLLCYSKRMKDTNALDKKRPWKRFFVISCSITIAFVVLSIVGTIVLQISTPPDCPSCSMAAIGLAPLYLLAGISIIILWIGFGVWLVKRVFSRWVKALVIVVTTLPLFAYAMYLLVTF